MDATFWRTLLLFSLTYLGLAIGTIPGMRIDRAGIALLGATAMLVTGVLTFEQAFSDKCINYEALVLLFGMMVVVGMLRLSGFFARLTGWFLTRIQTPRQLLALTIGLSGLLSAFLVNDIICLALTPLILELARKLRFHPVPHLIGLATASNIGAVGAITGNPQNMIIGIHSRISYLRFSAKLFPIALIGLVLAYLLIAWLYRRQLTAPVPATSPPTLSRGHPRLQRKALLVALGTVVLFFALPSQYLAIIALTAASVLFLGGIKPEKLYRQVDWGLLVMFAGLFIIVAAFRLHIVEHWQVASWSWLLDRPIDLLSLVSATMSNLVSNVPAVLLFEPVMTAMPETNRETAWLALAMSSTLAGNFTLLGSVANLIVVENARREGVEVSFLEYCKVGVPLTLVTLTVGIAWLSLARY